MFEHLHAEIKLCLFGHAAVFKLIDHALVIHRVHDGRDILPVLCRGAQHRRPADIDVLNRFFERNAFLLYRGLEWVQVNRHDVDQPDTKLLHLRHVVGVVPHREDSGMNVRMQRFHAPIETFGKARDV